MTYNKHVLLSVVFSWQIFNKSVHLQHYDVTLALMSKQPPMRHGLAPVCLTLPANDAMPVAASIAHTYAQHWSMTIPQALTAVRHACDSGDVVDAEGHALSATQMLTVGAVYLYRRIPDEGPLPHLDILWENDDALIVNKPPGLATIPRGQFIARSVVVAARRQFDNDNIVAAHRLDRLTSGCLLLMKNPNTRSTYQQLFQTKEVDRTYQAWTHPGDGALQGEYTWALFMHKPAGSLQVKVDDTKAATTVTQARVVSRHDDYLEWVVHPQTGFMHQIRVALAWAGYPIIGDPLYPRILDKDDQAWNGPMYLHAQTLAFTDPVTGEKVHVLAPTPA